jgi:hypothetical protein
LRRAFQFLIVGSTMIPGVTGSAEFARVDQPMMDLRMVLVGAMEQCPAVPDGHLPIVREAFNLACEISGPFRRWIAVNCLGSRMFENAALGGPETGAKRRRLALEAPVAFPQPRQPRFWFREPSGAARG